ncbi:MAG: hypothetical protein IJZ88_05855 [Clostridia bacterium]|nr:hypothetical protein [Clostridia bacterium]
MFRERLPRIEIYGHQTGDKGTVTDVYIDGKKIDQVSAVRYECQAGKFTTVSIDFLTDDVTIVEPDMELRENNSGGFAKYHRDWIVPLPTMIGPMQRLRELLRRWLSD